MPLIWFAIFNAPDDQIAELEPAASFPTARWLAETSYQQYRSAIARIHHEIAAGNTYQLNYTIRLKSNFDGNPYDFYRYLLNAQHAPYSAYLNIGRYQIVSASPELFFHWHNDNITTKPMKGTAKRGTTQQNDIIQQKNLHSSTKNLAENVMIVDLLRNDLSQIAKPGTVHVESLFDLEKYPTVWQMTSCISAKTRPNLQLTELFKALFPCGSITGAPKMSTMQLIAELEPSAREVYCGAIGFITPQKEALFSVPIRTVTIDSFKKTMCYGVGGGITWDSTTKGEYQEMLDKTQVLNGIALPSQLIETLLLSDGNYRFLNLHLQRLIDSAQYFNFTATAKQIKAELIQFAQGYDKDKWKVRLLLDKKRDVTLEATAFTPLNQPLTAYWSPIAVNSENPLLYHKTIERSHYPTAAVGHEYLIYNQYNEITEFVNGNVALLINGQWITPALSCGLLPGIMRQSLLNSGQLIEAVMSKDTVILASKIAFINSVRGWLDVTFNPTN